MVADPEIELWFCLGCSAMANVNGVMLAYAYLHFMVLHRYKRS